MTRAERISEARKRQPYEELKRKADKARTRHYYTQEDLDWSSAYAERLLKGINWE